jgi:predicted ArsR family transcriptional regulator
VKKLSDRQLRIVAWLQSVKPKTQQEIAERFMVCTATVRNYMSDLHQHGLVEVRGRKGRALTYTSIKKEKDAIRTDASRNQSSHQVCPRGNDPVRVRE